MAHATGLGHRVSQVKASLDQLQDSIADDEHSTDELMRLNQALNEINEEVLLLRNMMQPRKP